MAIARHMKSTLCLCHTDSSTTRSADFHDNTVVSSLCITSKNEQLIRSAIQELRCFQSILSQQLRHMVSKFTLLSEITTLADLITIELGFPVNYQCVAQEHIDLKSFVYTPCMEMGSATMKKM